MMLSKASSSATTGCEANATPAVAVGEGSVTSTSFVATLGLTTMLLDVMDVTPGAPVVKLKLMVSAVLYDKALKVAMPFASVTVNGPPCNAAVPAPRETVTVVVLSDVITLLNASVSKITG